MAINPPYRFDPLQNPVNVKWSSEAPGGPGAPWKRKYTGPYDFEANGGTQLAGADPNFLYGITGGFFAPPNTLDWVWHEGSYFHFEA